MLLKHIHVASVALSYGLFFLRGIWVMRDTPVMHQRWMKIAPHAVDTVLLVSAVALAYRLGISPLEAPWLMAKIIADVGPAAGKTLVTALTDPAHIAALSPPERLPWVVGEQ